MTRLGYNDIWMLEVNLGPDAPSPGGYSKMNLASQGNAKILRCPNPWAWVQPTEDGGLQWDSGMVYKDGSALGPAWDRYVNRARALGMTPIIQIDAGGPGWVKQPHPEVKWMTDKWGPPPAYQINPDKIGACADWAAAVAQRYNCPLEILNEPNYNRFGQYSANQYKALFEPVLAAVRAVKPNLRVLTGGLSPIKVFDSNVGYAWKPYLNSLLEMNGDYDVAIHIYSATAGFAVDVYRDARKIVPAKRDIWVTEFGFSTHRLSLLEQRQQLRETFRHLHDLGCRVAVVHRFFRGFIVNAGHYDEYAVYGRPAYKGLADVVAETGPHRKEDFE